jgi:hypothetical protein
MNNSLQQWEFLLDSFRRKGNALNAQMNPSIAYPASFVLKDGVRVLNPAWLDPAFEMHAAYMLHIEKLIVESRGKTRLVFVPQGPAQRRVIYTVAGSSFFSLLQCVSAVTESLLTPRVLQCCIYQDEGGRTSMRCIRRFSGVLRKPSLRGLPWYDIDRNGRINSQEPISFPVFCRFIQV